MINYTTLSATVRNEILPTVIDTVYQGIDILKILLAYNKVIVGRVGPDGSIEMPFLINKPKIRSHDNQYGTLVYDVTGGLLDKGKIFPATLYGTITVTRETEKVVENNPNAVIDSVEVQIAGVQASLIEDIEKRIYQQLPVEEGRPINSLNMMIDNGDQFSTYLGLSRAQYPTTRSYVLDKENKPLTYEDIVQAIDGAEVGGEAPTLIIASPKLWRKMNVWVKEQQHIYVQNETLFKLGVRHFKICEIPCIKSRWVPEGTIYFVNLNYIGLFVLQGKGGSKEDNNRGISFTDFVELPLMTAKGASIMFDGNIGGASRYHSKIINAV